MRKIFTAVLAFAVFGAAFALSASSVAAQDAAKPARTFEEYVPWLAQTGLDLTDYHIHLRGGMTAEKAVERARKTGLKSGVLENHGRDWPLSSNEILDKFIADVEKYNATLPRAERVKIGIQVNDRDWFKTIDPKIYRRLDYVLADTMIMGVGADGKPQKLWLLPKDYETDEDVWFERYFQHCMTVVNEPVDILANVTYLPDFIADRYDELWTEARMRALIQAAIDNNVALEVQAESAFPKPRFVELALEMGAKLSFGSNNFDDVLKDSSAWKATIERFEIKNENLWRDGRWEAAQGTEPQGKPAAKSTPAELFTWEINETGAVLCGFRGDKKHAEIVIPAEVDGRPVVAIGEETFFNCGWLKSIVLPETLQTIGDNAFSLCNSLASIEFPEKLKTIGSHAFWGCASLTSVKLPKGLQRLDYRAFAQCESLTSVEFPKELRMIETRAFQDCQSLASLSVADGNAAYKSVDGVLFSKDGKTLILYPRGRKNKTYRIPQGVKTVAAYAFDKCDALTSVEFPEDLQTFAWSAFYACNALTSFSVAPGNASYKSVDGVLFSQDGQTLVHYPRGRKTATYQIPQDVETIGDYAFDRCKSLRLVKLPEGLKTIGDQAFDDCSSLASIEFPEGLKTIGDQAFAECRSLTSIELPNELKTIGKYTFAGCESLVSVKFPENLQAIGGVAFYGCESLISLEFPKELKTIDDDAFGKCGALRSVKFPEGLQTIGNEAFAESAALKSVEVPDGTKIGDEAFPVDCEIRVRETPTEEAPAA